jgi:hypothetical protein
MGPAIGMTVTTSRSSENSRQIERTFALGLGLTNECNLACSFCYRDPTRTDRLSLDQVRSVMASLPVRSVNLGTGENGMHPEFAAMLDYLRGQPIKLTITSNGYSTEVLDDAQVAPAVIALDVAAFKGAGRDVIGVGHCGGADQRAGGKADTEADTEARAGLRFAADGGEGGGQSEGGEGGGDGLGVGHGGLHPFEFKAAIMAAYHSVAGTPEKVQNPFKPAGCPDRPGNDKLRK